MTGKIKKVIGKAKQKLSPSRLPAGSTSERSQADAVDEMIDESFPASDPPAHTVLTRS